jgi:hydroxymethylbilane synthase
VAAPRELGRAVGLELLDKGAAAIIEKSRPDLHPSS